MDGDVPFVIAFTSLFLSVFTAASAIWAFYGDNLSRIILLIFVSLNILWWIFLILNAIAYSEAKKSGMDRFYFSTDSTDVCFGIYLVVFDSKVM